MPQSALMIGAMVAIAAPAGWGTTWLVHSERPEPQSYAATLIAADMLIVVAAWLEMPPDFLFPVTCALGWVLVVLMAFDIAHFRLPDYFTLPLAVAGIGVAAILPDARIMDHIIGAAAGFAVLAFVALIYQRLRGREGLGLGDAKLTAAAGAWLGWQALPSVIVVASLGGILWIAARTIFHGRSSLNERIAFGVPLCAAFGLTWLYGPVLEL